MWRWCTLAGAHITAVDRFPHDLLPKHLLPLPPPLLAFRPSSLISTTTQRGVSVLSSSLSCVCVCVRVCARAVRVYRCVSASVASASVPPSGSQPWHVNNGEGHSSGAAKSHGGVRGDLRRGPEARRRWLAPTPPHPRPHSTSPQLCLAERRSMTSCKGGAVSAAAPGWTPAASSTLLPAAPPPHATAPPAWATLPPRCPRGSTATKHRPDHLPPLFSSRLCNRVGLCAPPPHPTSRLPAVVTALRQ